MALECNYCKYTIWIIIIALIVIIIYMIASRSSSESFTIDPKTKVLQFSDDEVNWVNQNATSDLSEDDKQQIAQYGLNGVLSQHPATELSSDDVTSLLQCNNQSNINQRFACIVNAYPDLQL